MDMLKQTYLIAKEHIDRGYKVWPAAVAPLWDGIVAAVGSGLPIYDACYCAAKVYAEENGISIDDAFSSIICEMGVSPRSAVWYEIMAAHFARQAEREAQRLVLD